jgi:ferritin-like metal-binding protein YciE
VFEMMDKSARGAIEGLVEEGKEVMNEAEPVEVMDAELIAAAQAVEHCEIARNGAPGAWAGELGMKDAVKLLEQALEEEEQTAALLNKIALERVSRRAASARQAAGLIAGGAATDPPYFLGMRSNALGEGTR